jgi:hypothetical protein
MMDQRTSPLRSNGEGDRSADRLSGGGASRGFTQAIDLIGDGIRVGEHVRSGDPNNRQPERFDVTISPAVSVLASIMRCAIDFDHHPGRRTIKVCDIGPDRMLLAKTKLAAAQTQHTPEEHFGKAELAAQPSRGCHRFACCMHPLWPLHHPRLRGDGPPPHRYATGSFWVRTEQFMPMSAMET